MSRITRIAQALLLGGVLAGCAAGTGAPDDGDRTSPRTQSEKPTETAAGKEHAAAVTVKGEEFSPEALLDKLNEKNQQFATGWSPSTDIWIISIQEVALRDGMTEAEAADIAAIRAKNEIASYMGSSVSAQEELIYTEETVNGEAVAKEFFKSIQRVDVNQFLRGVTIFKQEVKDGKLVAAFYVTGKLIDASVELEKQLRAAPPGTVRAIGFCIIEDGKIAPARKKALQSALRNAVEQVMGTTVVGQSQLMDNAKAKSKVISQTVGAIKQYRIVKEAPVGENYQVIVNAQVDEKQLLDNYAAMVRSMGNPGFFVKSIDPDLHYALSGFLSDLGISVVKDQGAAQFIVDAECQYLPVEDDHYGKGIQIDLGLTLYDVATGQKLFSLRNTPRLTSTYSGNFNQIRQSAAGKAFKTMKKQIHEKLDKVVMDWVLNGHDVKVVFRNTNGSRDLAKTLEEAIRGVPCAELRTRKLDGNTMEFLCSYVGPTADFEDFLAERLGKDLPAGISVPKTTKIDMSTLELTF